MSDLFEGFEFEHIAAEEPLCEKKKGMIKDDIAIIGMSVKVNGADSLDEFWDLMASGEDCIREVSTRRKKDIEEYIDYIGGDKQSIVYKEGSYLSEIDKFDPKFFRMTPKEAALSNPRQRIFLEKAWEAIENAGYAGERIEGSKTGVFVGYIADYEGYHYKQCIQGTEGTSAMSIPGNLASILPSRISYLLDLRGPSMLIDTACSSSLVAIHMACESLMMGNCDMALAGSIRLDLMPFQVEEKIGIESSTGKTKPFDESSDGTGFGEGVGVVMLKPLSKAIDDGDNIYATILGSAINQDGASAGITAPNLFAQRDVLIDAWENAGINPEEISFIETHGTGTKIGDPIEIDAITKAFQSFTNKKQFCAISSVKSNIGHLLEAAGIIGLIRTVLSMQHKKITPTLHFNKPNQEISFEESPVYLNNRLIPWEVESARIAGISSFGFSGTNCHMILQEPPVLSRVSDKDKDLELLVFSAKTPTALIRLIQKYHRYVSENDRVKLKDMCYTAAVGRKHYSYRIAILASTMDQLRERLMLLSNNPEAEIEIDGVYRSGFINKTINNENNSLMSIREQLRTNRMEAMKSLALQYVEGMRIAWNEIYDCTQCRTLALPTYPFERIRCWYEIKEAERSKDQESYKNNPKADEKRITLKGKKEGELYTQDEELLASVIGKVLGYEEINVNKSFYEMGCDSIAFAKIKVQLQEQDVAVEMEHFFENSTIAKLALVIADSEKTIPDKKQLTRVDDKAYYQVSPGQRKMYILQSMNKMSCAYNVNSVFEIKGTLDKDRFRDAFLSLIERHEILRTVFEIHEGELVQRILPFDKELLDFSEIYLEQNRDLKDAILELIRPFELDQAPLFRVMLITDNSKKTYFMLDSHHIICDISSFYIFTNELGRLYRGEILENPKFQYRDYTYWILERQASDIYNRQRQYWLNEFKTVPHPLMLPTDYSYHEKNDLRGSSYCFNIELDLKNKLQSLSYASNTTLHMLLLSVVSLLMSKLSGQEDITIGCPIACRNQSDLHEILGIMMNTIVIRTQPIPDLSFKQYLQEVRKKVLQAYDNQEYQFEELVEELNIEHDSGRNPLFNVMFVLQNPPNLNMEDIRFEEYIYDRNYSLFDLSFVASLLEDRIQFSLTYNDNLFDLDSIMIMVERYMALLTAITENIECKLKDIHFFTSDEMNNYYSCQSAVTQIDDDFDF